MFWIVIRIRRSSRSFKPHSLDAESIKTIKTAIFSPSGSNAQ
ncbi:hypothetical protein [Alicyclobacillus herbarius]|nr:hypothetical protein [Alicyclobacillus herbarius]